MRFAQGRVPAFLRPARPKSGSAGADGKSPSAAAAEREASAAEPAAAARRTGGAYFPTVAELVANKRRLFAMATPEQLALRMTFSDAIGLAPLCRAAACRRAGRCRGVAGARCLLDHEEIVRPLYPAVKLAAEIADAQDAGADR